MFKDHEVFVLAGEAISHNSSEELEKDMLVRDENSHLYIYGQELKGKMMFGIIGLVELH